MPRAPRSLHALPLAALLLACTGGADPAASDAGRGDAAGSPDGGAAGGGPVDGSGRGAVALPATDGGAVLPEASGAGALDTLHLRGRTWGFYRPPAPRTPTALLVFLHGCGQDAVTLAAATGMNGVADEAGFFVAYPEQPPTAHPQRCWRWYLPEHQGAEAGEPASLRAELDELITTQDLGAPRIALAGFSAGAAMAQITALAWAERVEAVMLLAGVPYGAADDVTGALRALQGGATSLDAATDAARSLLGGQAAPRALIAHGSADSVVAAVNGTQLRDQWRALQGWPLVGAGSDERVSSERVPADPASFASETTRHSTAAGEPRVAYIAIEGLDHAWPGSSSTLPFTSPRGPPLSAWLRSFWLPDTGG